MQNFCSEAVCYSELVTRKIERNQLGRDYKSFTLQVTPLAGGVWGGRNVTWEVKGSPEGLSRGGQTCTFAEQGAMSLTSEMAPTNFDGDAHPAHMVAFVAIFAAILRVATGESSWAFILPVHCALLLIQPRPLPLTEAPPSVRSFSHLPVPLFLCSALRGPEQYRARAGLSESPAPRSGLARRGAGHGGVVWRRG